jgi:hypothetical protein
MVPLIAARGEREGPRPSRVAVATNKRKRTGSYGPGDRLTNPSDARKTTPTECTSPRLCLLTILDFLERILCT